MILAVALALLLTVFPGIAGAGYQWTPLGPGGGTVRDLAIDPEAPATLYAAIEDRGVWKTTDGGATWRRSPGVPSGISLFGIVVAPDAPATVYVTGGGAIYKTTDGGAHWATVHAGPGAFYSPVIDPQDPDVVYAGGYGDVLRSADRGATWTPTPLPGIGTSAVAAIAIDPGTPTILYAGGFGTGVWKSTDAGTSWVAASNGLTSPDVWDIAVDPVTPGTVYVGTFSGGLFKTVDGGTSWTLLANGPAGVGWHTLRIDPLQPATVYAGAGVVYRSLDGGTTWQPHPLGGGSVHIDAIVLDPQTPGQLYAGSWDGVFRSTDDAATWTRRSAGLPEGPQVESVTIDATGAATLYAGTRFDWMWRTTDGGGTWTRTNTALPLRQRQVAADPRSPGTVYAFGPDGAGVWRTIDGGDTWVAASTGFLLSYESATALAIDPVTPGTLYAATNFGRIYRSTTSAATWLPTGLGIGATLLGLAIDPLTPTTLYAGGGTIPRVLKTVDGWSTWSGAGVGLPSLNSVGALAVDPTTPSIVYAGYDYGDGVYRSTDGGASWTPRRTGLPVDVLNALAIDPLARAVYAATGAGLYVSFDGGGTWSRYQDGLPESGIEIRGLAADPAQPLRVYAGVGDYGLFRLDITRCQSVADCDDGNACTTDACAPDDPGADDAGCLHPATVCPVAGACQVGNGCNPLTGLCEYTPGPDGTACDDGEPCTVDRCVAGACEGGPYPACRPSAAGALRLVQPPARDARLTARLEGDVAASLAELGTPYAGTTYYVCVHDAGGVVLSARVPAGPWLPIGATVTGYRYVNRTRLPDGVERMLVRAGTRSRIAARGRGTNLSFLAPPLTLPVRLQVVRSDGGGACWEAPLVEVVRNEPGRFQAR